MLLKIFLNFLFFTYLLGFTNFNALELFICCGTFFILLNFVSNLGEKILFIDIIALLCVVQWITAPLISELLEQQMEVPLNAYYAIAIPGTLALILGLYLPVYFKGNDKNILPEIKKSLTAYYKTRNREILFYFYVGLVCWLLQPYVPLTIRYIFVLMSYFLFMSLGAMFFCEMKLKVFYFAGAYAAILFNTLFQGMVGTSLFLTFTLSSILIIARPVKLLLPLKIGLFFTAIWFIAILQSSKTEYRKETWKITGSTVEGEERETTTNPALFFSLIGERIIDPSKIFSHDFSVDFTNRINQGYAISQAMSFIPDQKEFARGEVTLNTTFMSFVPRVIWNDKPQLGTSEYFETYSGIALVAGYTVTFGALGDAYIDFGQYAFVFLFFLGLMLGSIYAYAVFESIKKPYLIIWSQIIFFIAISIPEISVSGSLNAIFKVMIFFVIIRVIQNAIAKRDLPNKLKSKYLTKNRSAQLIKNKAAQLLDQKSFS